MNISSEIIAYGAELIRRGDVKSGHTLFSDAEHCIHGMKPSGYRDGGE
jgi:hypothetical protein